MKKQMTVYVYWEPSQYEEGGGHFQFFTREGMGRYGDYVPAGSVEVDIDLPEGFDPRALLVESLTNKKAAIIRLATKEAEVLEEKIQQLLALPQGDAA